MHGGGLGLGWPYSACVRHVKVGNSVVSGGRVKDWVVRVGQAIGLQGPFIGMPHAFKQGLDTIFAVVLVDTCAKPLPLAVLHIIEWVFLYVTQIRSSLLHPFTCSLVCRTGDTNLNCPILG